MIPVPCIANVNGLLVESLFIIEIVAFLNPTPEGLKVTTKVVLALEPTRLLGAVVIVKSAAFAPVMLIAFMLKTPTPVLLIVNVLVEFVEPKSVQLVVEGTKLPLVMVFEFPFTLICE